MCVVGFLASELVPGRRCGNRECPRVSY